MRRSGQTLNNHLGPFLDVALTGRGRAQTHIGIARSVGTMAALVCQVPGSAMVDHQKRVVLAVAPAVIGIAALLFGTNAHLLGAEVLHSGVAMVLTPATVAVTLTTCSDGAFGGRLGSASQCCPCAVYCWRSSRTRYRWLAPRHSMGSVGR